MANVEVYFFGLICHVGNNTKKKHAAIINGLPTHKAHVVVDGNVLIDLAKGDNVKFDQTAPVEWTQELEDHLPHLNKCIKGGTPALWDTVDTGADDSSVIGYVKYPKSSHKLDVADMYWPNGAVYLDDAESEVFHLCPASLVVLPVDPNPLTVYWGSSGKDTATRWILIFNSAHSPSQNDFDRYLAITKATKITHVKHQDLGCRRGTYSLDYRDEVLDYITQLAKHKTIVDATDVECANSHWP